MPEGLLRLYERRKWQRSVLSVPLPSVDALHRVLVTPARHAGQGKLWSDALNTLEGVSSRSITVQNDGFGHDADYTVSWVYATLSRKWQRELRRTLRAHYTHVLVEASLPPLGGSFGGDFRRQVRWLQQQGLKVAFVAHGSEIRLPSRHAKTEPWSPFNDVQAAELSATLETVAARNAELYRDFAVPSFVSTAGLLADLPQAAFLGLIVDGRRFAAETPPFTGEKLIACHVSSHSVLKATSELGEIMRGLEAEGLIEFREYSGVPQDDVPGILGASDIVLDQFALGDYGVFACEGMASGRLVLSHVNDQVRAEIAQRTGHELPIPETTLENVERRIRDIVADRERYREIAARGPEFVRSVHGGGYSAGVLYENFVALE